MKLIIQLLLKNSNFHKKFEKIYREISNKEEIIKEKKDMFTSDFYAEVSKSNDKASYTIKNPKANS